MPLAARTSVCNVFRGKAKKIGGTIRRAGGARVIECTAVVTEDKGAEPGMADGHLTPSVKESER